MLNLAYSLYVFVLVFAPIALGATHIWAKMAVETITFLALFLVLADKLRTGRKLYKVPGILLCGGFVFWILVQLIPLPSSVLAWLSPSAHAIYATIHGPAESSFWAPLTIKPQYTVQELFRFAGFSAIYYLTVQLLADRQRLKQTLSIVLAVAGLIAFQGIVQSFTGNGRIFWVVEAGPDAFFGPFFYRNHYAGFMAMLLPVALALFLYHRPHTGYGVPLRQKIVHLFDQLKQSPSFRFGLIAIILFASILLSQSRTGISMAVLTTGAMLLFSRKLFRLNRTSPALIALLVVLAVVVIGKTGLDKVDVRLGEVINSEGFTETGKTITGRTQSWEDSLQIIADFPVTGSGMGTFFAIYPSYKTVLSETPLRQAHNEYLEMATDGGLIAIALITAFLIFFFRQNLSLYRLRRDSFARHLFLGALTGVVALLLHSITDYQFRQTSAVPLYFFFLLGVQTVAIHSRRTGSGDSSLLLVSPPKKPLTTALCAGLLLFIPLALLFHSGEMIALAGYEGAADNNELLNLSPDTSQETLLVQYQKALRAAGYDPFNPIYPTAAAYTAQFLGETDRADQAFRKALRLDPANANTLQLYAEYLTGQDDKEEEAQRLLQASVERDKNSRQRLLFYVYWLLGQGEFDKGIPAARDMLEQYPDLAQNFMLMLQESPLPPEIIPQTLPERVAPRIAYAALLEKSGNLDEAADAYDIALSYMDREQTIKPGFFNSAVSFFKKRKEEARLLAVLQQAVTYLPNEYSFRLQLGDLYIIQGMHRKAFEEYRFAQQIKPGDPQIQQRLKTLEPILKQ